MVGYFLSKIYLLSIHEAIFLFDVDLVDSVALLSAGFVTDAAVRSTHHSAFASRHLGAQTQRMFSAWTQPCF